MSPGVLYPAKQKTVKHAALIGVAADDVIPIVDAERYGCEGTRDIEPHELLAAFAEEIFWAGILSVPKGQWEAARSTGFGFLATLTNIVLPQAVRLTVPPITNRTVAITKNTALGTVIGVPEILNQATTAQSFSGNATPLMMGALAYIILFIPVVALGRFLETRFAWRRG